MAEFILADILDGDDEDEAVEALLAEVLKRYEFDESKIERHPAGSPEGGRFAPKDGGSSSASTREEHITKLEDAGREWLKSKLNGAEPTRNDLSSMARYLGAEHADKVNAIIKDFDDYSKYPERPAVRLTVGGQGVPDVWLLGWRENEKGLEATPIHDHGNSEAGVYVHKGAVNERIFAINKAEVGQGEIEFREVDRGLDNGSAITINAPYLHDIGAQKGAGTSVTIHAYYPPLNEMNFYEIKGSKLIKSGSWKESTDTRAAKGFTRDHDFPCFVYSKNKYHDPSEQRFIRAYEWDEDKHPRDELGRWTDTEGALQGNENENGPVPQDSAGTTEGGQRQLPNVPRGAVTHTSPESEAFKAWFKDSKVVDADGKPLVVYHGGASGFEVFDISKVGSVLRSDWGPGFYFTRSKNSADYYREQAVRRTDPELNAAHAEYDRLIKNVPVVNGSPQYSEESKAALDKIREIGARLDKDAGKGRILEAYLNIKNPLIEVVPNMSITDPYLAERAKSRGHDGIFIMNYDGTQIDEIIAFDPEQIKSKFNTGTWNPKDKRISYEHREYHRELTKYERKVNFAKAEDAFARLIATTDDKLRDVLKEVQKSVIKHVRETLDNMSPRAAGSFRIDVGQKFFDTFKDFLLTAWRDGKNHGYDELPEPLKRSVRLIKTFEFDPDQREYHYPGGEDHDQSTHGNWATGDGGFYSLLGRAVDIEEAKKYHGDGSHDEKDHGNWAHGSGVENLPDNVKLDPREEALSEMFSNGRWSLKATERETKYEPQGHSYRITIEPKVSRESIETVEMKHGGRLFTDTEIAESKEDEYGRYITSLKPDTGYTENFDDLFKAEPGVIFRGMSYDEWAQAKERGYFESRGSYNVGQQEQGLTYFSADPNVSRSYAGSFAPYPWLPTLDKPGVVIAIKRPTDARENADTGEIPLKGRIPFESVEASVEMRPAGMTSGYLDIIRGQKGYTSGSQFGASVMRWAYRKIPKSDLKRFAGFEPRKAIDYLTAKALVIKGLLDNELTEDVRQLLLEHLKGGRTLTETLLDLREMFEPWIGDPETVIERPSLAEIDLPDFDFEPRIGPSGQVGINTPPGTKSPDNVLQAYRLENMIRTPLIEAYNQGRLAIGDATDEYVIGYQYSAILDSRTTVICGGDEERGIPGNDGLVIRAEDPRLIKLTPPVHFQCRSILVYVTIDDTPVEWSSDEELDAAVERIQEGFA